MNEIKSPRRSLRRPSPMLLALMGSLCLAGTASAGTYPGAGVFYGNKCVDGRGNLVNYGVEVCYWTTSFTAGSKISFAFGAYDLSKDKNAARVIGQVQQLVKGQWVLPANSTITMTNTNGYPYTRVSGAYSFNRYPGATHLRLVLYACSFDVAKNAYVSKASKVAGSAAW